MKYTRPNTELKPKEIEKFLNVLQNVKINDWETPRCDDKFVCEIADRNDDILLVIVKRKTITVDNVHLCECEILYNRLIKQLDRKRNRVAVLIKKKEERRRQKVINTIKYFGD